MTARKICFDRILPQDLNRPLPRPQLPLEAIVVIRKLWPNGSTLRIRFMEGGAMQRDLALEQAGWWSEHANLAFTESEDLDSEIRITFDQGDGAWSYIGTDNRSIPQDQPTMNLGFLDGGTSAHEFGHAIGFGHEHQNPDGGIEWNEAEVLRDLSGPPNFWTAEQARHNVIRRYSQSQIKGTQFDSESIMLYAFPGEWTRSGVATHANEKLSSVDADFAARVYPRERTSQEVRLSVDAPPISARIGVPGEEDLFTFTVDHAGRYVVETGGQTDVAIKLFGPDSRTAVVAQDDDSGVGLNARIAPDLIEGEYLVQVRHYNRNSGQGDYTLKVVRGH